MNAKRKTDWDISDFISNFYFPRNSNKLKLNYKNRFILYEMNRFSIDYDV